MKIGGLQKMSLIDYPSKIAAVLFLSGCNFRCGYCHNKELVKPSLIKNHPKITENEFFDFLDSRKGLLDGVCLTGGEPTINFDLPNFLKKIKQRGFLIKLDTNGSNPEMLEKLFKDNLLDFTAMDIKAASDKYSQIASAPMKPDSVSKSINLIKKSGRDYEFRTTAAPWLIDEKEIKKIGRWLKGAKCFILQQFRPEKTLDESFKEIKPYSKKKLTAFIKIIKPFVEKAELRGI